MVASELDRKLRFECIYCITRYKLLHQPWKRYLRFWRPFLPVVTQSLQALSVFSAPYSTNHLNLESPFPGHFLKFVSVRICTFRHKLFKPRISISMPSSGVQVPQITAYTRLLLIHHAHFETHQEANSTSIQKALIYHYPT